MVFQRCARVGAASAMLYGCLGWFVRGGYEDKVDVEFNVANRRLVYRDEILLE